MEVSPSSENSVSTLSLLRLSLLSTLVSLFVCWIPFSPILGFLGPAVAAFIYQKESINKKTLRVHKQDQIILNLCLPLFSSILLSVAFLVLFYSFYLQPYSFQGAQEWFKIELFDDIVKNVREFKYLFLLISFLVSYVSGFVGSLVVFGFGIGQKAITEEEYISNLTSSDLEDYLDWS